MQGRASRIAWLALELLTGARINCACIARRWVFDRRRRNLRRRAARRPAAAPPRPRDRRTDRQERPGDEAIAPVPPHMQALMRACGWRNPFPPLPADAGRRPEARRALTPQSPSPPRKAERSGEWEGA